MYPCRLRFEFNNSFVCIVDERQCKIRVVERLSEFQQAIHNNSVNKADTAAETVMDDFVDVCNKDLTFDDRAADEMTDKEIEIYSEMLLERVLEQLVRIAHTDEELMEELNCVDETGLSLLHYVCFYKYARFVPFLVAHGAQVNQQSTQGQTALHIAAGCGHQDVVQVLLEYQADLFVYDHLGLTAADRAESAGHFDVALQLRQLMTISPGDGIQECQDNGFAESNALVRRYYIHPWISSNVRHVGRRERSRQPQISVGSLLDHELAR